MRAADGDRGRRHGGTTTITTRATAAIAAGTTGVAGVVTIRQVGCVGIGGVDHDVVGGPSALALAANTLNVRDSGGMMWRS